MPCRLAGSRLRSKVAETTRWRWIVGRRNAKEWSPSSDQTLSMSPTRRARSVFVTAVAKRPVHTRPNGVSARAVVAYLVDEALNHDQRDRWHLTCGRHLLAVDRAQRLGRGGAARAGDSAAGRWLEPKYGSVRRLAELDWAPGRSPSQNGIFPGSQRPRDEHAVVRNLLRAPGARSKQDLALAQRTPSLRRPPTRRSPWGLLPRPKNTPYRPRSGMVPGVGHLDAARRSARARCHSREMHTKHSSKLVARVAPREHVEHAVEGQRGSSRTARPGARLGTARPGSDRAHRDQFLGRHVVRADSAVKRGFDLALQHAAVAAAVAGGSLFVSGH